MKMREVKEIRVFNCDYFPQANGKSYYKIRCPFCGKDIIAYARGVSGNGKKCTCGALLVVQWFGVFRIGK